MMVVSANPNNRLYNHEVVASARGVPLQIDCFPLIRAIRAPPALGSPEFSPFNPGSAWSVRDFGTRGVSRCGREFRYLVAFPRQTVVRPGQAFARKCSTMSWSIEDRNITLMGRCCAPGDRDVRAAARE